jgi:hypothetical protein
MVSELFNWILKGLTSGFGGYGGSCVWGYKKDFQKVIDYESYLRFAVYGDDVDDFFSYYRPFKCWLLLIHISYGCSSAISIHLDSLENAGVEHVMKSIDFSENLPDTVFFNCQTKRGFLRGCRRDPDAIPPGEKTVRVWLCPAI